MDTRVNAPVDGPDSGQVGAYLDLVASRDVGGARTLVLSELSVGDGGLARVIDELLVMSIDQSSGFRIHRRESRGT